APGPAGAGRAWGAARGLRAPPRGRVRPRLAAERARAGARLRARGELDDRRARDRLALHLEEERREARALERARRAVLRIAVGERAQHLERDTVRAGVPRVRAARDPHRPV